MREFLALHWDACALWVLFAGCIEFALMGVDKRKARRGDWRVPEFTLWLFALVGGAVGGVLGMRCFHHKTRHLQFQIGFPILAVLDVFFLIWLIG